MHLEDNFSYYHLLVNSVLTSVSAGISARFFSGVVGFAVAYNIYVCRTCYFPSVLVFSQMLTALMLSLVFNLLTK